MKVKQASVDRGSPPTNIKAPPKYSVDTGSPAFMHLILYLGIRVWDSRGRSPANASLSS